MIAILCDVASTIYFMVKFPQTGDVHPAIQQAANVFGPVFGPLVGGIGKIGGGLLVAIYLRRWSHYIFITGAILAFWAAWYNVWGFQSGYYPNIYRIIFW